MIHLYLYIKEEGAVLYNMSNDDGCQMYLFFKGNLHVNIFVGQTKLNISCQIHKSFINIYIFFILVHANHP